MDLRFPPDHRFRLVRRLGAGGMGVVHEAHDRERGCAVALKTLPQLSGEGLYRLKREFRALADLAHPNVVGYFDLFVEFDRAYYTMELVGGVDLVRWCRAGEADDEPGQPFWGGPDGPARAARLRAAFAQLAAGVRAIHEARLLHRDLKPGNIVVTPAGRVVIIDFGLAAVSRDGAASTVTSRFAGTPAYMAPEQARTGPVLGPEADWYAFGAVLYEALTGAPAFAGGHLSVLEAKRQRPATPPTLASPDVPAALDALCVGLMATDPSARAPHIARIDAVLQSSTASDDPPAPPPEPDGDEPFTGRADELATLRAAFARTLAGEAVVVAAEGASGIGKTALIARFIAEIRAAQPGAMLLSGRCYERESVPFKAIDALIDDLSDDWRRRSRGAALYLLPRDAASLAQVFPTLARVPAVAEQRAPPATLEPMEVRHRGFGALRELLARATARWPVVLFLDDLQWIDGETASLLPDLVRAPDAPPILLLLSTRTRGDAPAARDSSAVHDPPSFPSTAAPQGHAGETPRRATDTGSAQTVPFSRAATASSHPGHDLLDRIAADGCPVTRLPLGPLDLDASHALARALLPAAHRHLVEDVVHESGRNPFFIQALARHRTQPGSLAERQPPTEFAPAPSVASTTVAVAAPTAQNDDARPRTQDDPPTPSNLATVVAHRLAALSDPARHLTELLCVAGDPIEAPIVAKAAGLDAADFAPLAHQLVVARLARRGPGPAAATLAPYHDRIRETVVALLPPPRRIALHAALATVLNSASADAARISRHFLAADLPRQASPFILQAARDAATSLAFDYAATLYQQFLHLTEDRIEDLGVHLEEYGDALSNGGRGPEAAGAYLASSADAHGERLLLLKRKAAEQMLLCGRIDEGQRLLAEVLAEVSVAIPSSTLLRYASFLWNHWRIARRHPLSERFPGTARRRKTSQAGEALWAAALGTAMVDPLEASCFAQQLFFQSWEDEDATLGGNALLIYSMTALAVDARLARQLTEIREQAIPLTKRANSTESTPIYLLARGFHPYIDGNWIESRKHLREAGKALERTSIRNTWIRHSIHLYELYTALFMGDFTYSRHRKMELLSDASRRGDLYASTTLNMGLCVLPDIALGNVDAARASNHAAYQQWGQDRTQVHDWFYLLGEGLCLLAGDPQDDEIERFFRSVSIFRGTLLQRVRLLRVMLGYIGGRLLLRLLATGEAEDARLALVDREVRRLQSEDWPLATACADYLRGCIHLVRGDHTNARAALVRSRSSFTSLGMKADAAGARLVAATTMDQPTRDVEISLAHAEFLALGCVGPEPACRLWSVGL